MSRERLWTIWDQFVYRVPWALVLFWALIVYGVLAIGHGVHHVARANATSADQTEVPTGARPSPERS